MRFEKLRRDAYASPLAIVPRRADGLHGRIADEQFDRVGAWAVALSVNK